MTQEKQQVEQVQRKLVTAVHKANIQHAVDDGFNRSDIVDILLLCGGRDAEVRRMWDLFQLTPQQQASGNTFDMADFVAFIKAEQAKPRPPRGRSCRKAKKR